MARIRKLSPETSSTSQVHPTQVDCRWQVVPAGDSVLFQLSTYGSDDRESRPKVSQTIQLDRQTAIELVARLRETFDL